MHLQWCCHILEALVRLTETELGVNLLKGEFTMFFHNCNFLAVFVIRNNLLLVHISNFNMQHFVSLQIERWTEEIAFWTVIFIFDFEFYDSWTEIYQMSYFWTEICDVWFSFCDTWNGNGVEIKHVLVDIPDTRRNRNYWSRHWCTSGVILRCLCIK